jgi:hypothetical protein
MMRFALPAVLALLAACDQQRMAEPTKASATELTVASRVMVLAGDTLVIDGKHVQLANAVAPQGIPSARCWAEALAAKHAVQYVKRLLLEAQGIEVLPTGEVDGHGRTVATVSLDGLDLGRTLFDNGAAAQPSDGVFRWCEGFSQESDGGPTFSSLNEPGRS